MNRPLTMAAVLGASLLGGCADESGQQPRQPTAGSAPTAYALASEPEGAMPVIDARESVKDGDEVVVVGRIGGSEDPWVEGRAAFTIVDPKIPSCSDIPGDNCPTPWDYCCEANIGTKSALVKLVDAEGGLVKEDARELLKVSELDTVVVQGKAQRDEEGNLTVLARGIYVRPGSKSQTSHEHGGNDHSDGHQGDAAGTSHSHEHDNHHHGATKADHRHAGSADDQGTGEPSDEHED